jgi:hypothetical protein
MRIHIVGEAGKLALRFELERIDGLLRDRTEPFHPRRDREGFLVHLTAIGCERRTGPHDENGG